MAYKFNNLVSAHFNSLDPNTACLGYCSSDDEATVVTSNCSLSLSTEPTVGSPTTCDSAIGSPTTRDSAIGSPTTRDSAIGSPTTRDSAIGFVTTESSVWKCVIFTLILRRIT